MEVEVNHESLVMELDTGFQEVVKEKFPGASIQPSSVLLKIYTGEMLEIVGELQVQVVYRDQGPISLCLIVVKGKEPCLLGRNWLTHIKLDWQHIAAITMEQGAGKNLNVLLQKYVVVFEEKLGTITPHKVQLRV